MAANPLGRVVVSPWSGLRGSNREMAMQVLKQRVWSSLNNADAWVLGIGLLSCLGLVTGVLG
jgi:hypothetical protein